jgi:hypothetical protein
MNDKIIVELSKGMRLPVFLLLRNHPEGVTQRWLIVVTGSTDKTISSALEYLAATQRAARSRTSDGDLRWFLLIPEQRVGDSPTPIIINIDSSKSLENKEKESRNFSDSYPENGDREGFPNNLIDYRGAKTPQEWEDIWNEFRSAGIMRNERTLELARQDHVTLAYVRAKRAELQSSKRGGSQWAGALITILERNEPTTGVCEAAETVDQKVEKFLRVG